MVEEAVLGGLTLLNPAIRKLHLHMVPAHSRALYKMHTGQFASSTKKVVFSCPKAVCASADIALMASIQGAQDTSNHAIAA